MILPVNLHILCHFQSRVHIVPFPFFRPEHNPILMHLIFILIVQCSRHRPSLLIMFLLLFKVKFSNVSNDFRIEFRTIQISLTTLLTVPLFLLAAFAVCVFPKFERLIKVSLNESESTLVNGLQYRLMVDQLKTEEFLNWSRAE